MRIVHISDLHFGSELVRDKVVKAIRQINELEPDLVIATGDISCWGIHSEMRDAYETLMDIQSEILFVPGNHDARNNGREFFELYFGKTKKHYLSDTVSIIGVDSTEPDLDDGHVGHDQREWLKSKVRKNKINILVLHHHIVPIPKTGRERNVLIDAGEIVEILTSTGINIVLAGHRHMPYLAKLFHTNIIHAGTLGSFKVLGMPDQNYNIIQIDEDTLTLKLKFVDFGEVEVGRYRIERGEPESMIYHRIAKPKKVLFLSKMNDCRTLMAEAIFNRISPNNMLAVSAGVEPAGSADLKAIAVMREVGIKLNGKPRKINQEMLKDFDVIVEFDELGMGERWKIEKPVTIEDYRKVRREIWKRVEELVQRLLC